MREIEVDGRTVEVSHPDRVVFPDVGLTKGDLVDHVLAVGELMLPQVRGRPLAVKRYPDGIDASGFFQKSRPEHAPDWVGRVDVPLRRGGEKPHVVAEDVATLVFLTNLGAVELHRWLSCADDLEAPDELVVDLDPPEGSDVEEVRWAARRVRALLEDELELPTRVKTSGSKGYHVHVPVQPSVTFGALRAVADGVADVLAARHGDRLTAARRKADRGGRVFLDVGRNAYGQTIVTAYSVRARPGAPVATPIDWHELDEVEPRTFTVETVRRRLADRDDPWTGTPERRVTLDAAAARLRELGDAA